MSAGTEKFRVPVRFQPPGVLNVAASVMNRTVNRALSGVREPCKFVKVMVLPHSLFKGLLVENTTVMVLLAQGYGTDCRTVAALAPVLNDLPMVSRILPSVPLRVTFPHRDVVTEIVAV